MGKGIYTADMGQPPMDPEVAPPSKPKAKKEAPKPKEKTKGDSVWTEQSGIPVPQEPEVAKRKGGYVAAADGIASRGKTRGTMVMCGGGMAKRK
jgi:hypothetical protein